MMEFFKTCKTAEDVKATFKDLAKRLHPDCGGDAEQFKAMMTEYKVAFDRLKNVHVNSQGEQYERETSETAEQFADIINKVIMFEDVTIEIIGSWVWLSGNTFPYKDTIKEAGFFYSKSKKAWYYNGDNHKTRRRGRYSMKALREKWGSEVVENKPQEKLA